MGKRKRMSDHNKTPSSSGTTPCSSKMDSLLKEHKSSHSVESSSLRSLSSIMEIMDSSRKQPNIHHSHQNFSRPLLLRQPRHFYSRKYPRRNSANNDASSSRDQGIPREEKLHYNIASQYGLDSGHGKDIKEMAFCRPERIRSSSSGRDAGPSHSTKMVCGICDKLLKRKPHVFGNSISSGDVSVVAVLVCGHVFHAECLEQRTSHEDRRDPPCPACSAFDSQLGTSRAPE